MSSIFKGSEVELRYKGGFDAHKRAEGFDIWHLESAMRAFYQ